MVKIENKWMYEKKSHKENIQFKVEKRQREIVLNRLSIFVALRIYQGHNFIALLLKYIQITKELFVINIESGEEVRIPQAISMDNLPMSFQYYDPI